MKINTSNTETDPKVVPVIDKGPKGSKTNDLCI